MIFSLRYRQEDVIGLGSNIKTVVDISDTVVANIAQRNGKWIVQVKALLSLEDIKNLYEYLATIVEPSPALSTPCDKKEMNYYFAPV